MRTEERIWKEIQGYMGQAGDVYEWNDLRKDIKRAYGMTWVNRVDTSGLIKTVKENNKWPPR